MDFLLVGFFSKKRFKQVQNVWYLSLKLILKPWTTAFDEIIKRCWRESEFDQLKHTS